MPYSRFTKWNTLTAIFLRPQPPQRSARVQFPPQMQHCDTATERARERSPYVVWSTFGGPRERCRMLAALAAPGAFGPGGDRPLRFQLCVPHGQGLPHAERTDQMPFLASLCRYALGEPISSTPVPPDLHGQSDAEAKKIPLMRCRRPRLGRDIRIAPREDPSSRSLPSE